MAIIKESVSTLTSDGRLCWAAHHQPISDHHHDSYPFDFFHIRFTSSFLFYFILFFLWVFPWLWRDVNAETRGRRIASVLRLVAVRVARTKMMAWPPNSAARGLSLSLSLSLSFSYIRFGFDFGFGFVWTGMQRRCKKKLRRRRPERADREATPPLVEEVIAVTKNN